MVVNILTAMPDDRSPSAPHAASERRPVDEAALKRAAGRMRVAGAVPWLHTEVARRMAERLPLVKARPSRVLVWGASVGGGPAQIESVYRREAPATAPVFYTAVEPDDASLVDALRSASSPVADRALAEPASIASWCRRLFQAFSGPFRLPLPSVRVASQTLRESQVLPASAQLVWANMVLHGDADPLATMRRWHRALEVGGFLMFSCFGPGTLAQLRTLYAERAWGPAVTPQVDMHDLGDLLLQAGFAEPVMDQETLVLTWPDAQAALAELRTLGTNADPGRHPGLRTPRWRRSLVEALEAGRGPDGRFALSFEVAYGHAFRAPERAPVSPETRIELDTMRAMVRPASGVSRGGPASALG